MDELINDTEVTIAMLKDCPFCFSKAKLIYCEEYYEEENDYRKVPCGIRCGNNMCIACNIPPFYYIDFKDVFRWWNVRKSKGETNG